MHDTTRRRVRAVRLLENTVTTVGPNDNIFAALELRAADKWLVKAELAGAIELLIRDRQLARSFAPLDEDQHETARACTVSMKRRTTLMSQPPGGSMGVADGRNGVLRVANQDSGTFLMLEG